MMNLIYFIWRILQITIILAKHQIFSHTEKQYMPLRVKILGKFITFIFFPHKIFISPKASWAERIKNCLIELGPFYIKLGQSISTRPDLVGYSIASELEKLQDKVTSFEVKQVAAIIEKDLGGKIEQLFESFDLRPIAAASIAQVHKATLHSGEIVAVKILRPKIRKICSKELNIQMSIAKFITRISSKSKRLRLIEVVKTFENVVKLELDLRMEGAACCEMSENFKNDPSVKIPKVYWDHTSINILTTEWIDGISIYDTTKIQENNLNLNDIAEKIAILFFNQAYRDGYFHADMHPGNIFVMKDGTIALVDFGIMGRLPHKDRMAIAQILRGFINKDYDYIAHIHAQAGYIPQDTDLKLFAQACRSIGEPIVGKAINEISVAKLLLHLFKITEDFTMQTQPQLLLLQKTTVTIEGLGKRLNPQLNMWQLAEPWIRKWANRNLTPEAQAIKIAKYFIKEITKKIESCEL